MDPKLVSGWWRGGDLRHIPSSRRQVYYHYRGHAFTFGVTGGWVGSRWVCSVCWLGSRVRHVGENVPGDVSRNATRKNQNWWLPLLTAIMGAIPVSIFTSLSELPAYVLTRNKFEWIPYEDPAIQEVILKEFFVNPNTWHMKVLLVVFTIVEIYETDRVL
ncbi:hypothetical protein PVK06_020148 [Gossypium arboreum]|uniref:Uncharacterized protein n=1 Tax=Gossypium arboreum TaxID=29729 RepID=A0ABR0PM32_GOSAR|nr:hypothetical protein PVK06_020148 [Gossypium arboreum]